LTFMVGFWVSISSIDRGLDNPGPGQPFPDLAVSSYTWPHEMTFDSFSLFTNDSNIHVEDPQPLKYETSCAVDTLLSPTPHEPSDYLSVIWEPIKSSSETNAESGSPIKVSEASYESCFQGF
jgi:hypothetical protein